MKAWRVVALIGVGSGLGALLTSLARAEFARDSLKAAAYQAPRVCCRVRLPDQGDTIRIATICANVVAKDSVAVRVTR